MKSFTTAASLITLAAIVEGARNLPVEAVNIQTGKSLGTLWTEPIEPTFPDPVYGDEAFDVMFRKGRSNNKNVHLSDIEDPMNSIFSMNCARVSPSPCWGSGNFDVGGGEWEAGHYLVRADFRYDDTPGYSPDKGWIADGYNNETGIAEVRYIGGPHQPYAFYGKFSSTIYDDQIRTLLALTDVLGCSMRRHSRD